MKLNSKLTKYSTKHTKLLNQEGKGTKIITNIITFIHFDQVINSNTPPSIQMRCIDYPEINQAANFILFTVKIGSALLLI